MRTYLTLLSSVAAVMLGSSSCGPSNAPIDLGGPSGSRSWSENLDGSPRRGIDEGALFYLGSTFMIWTDASRGIASRTAQDSSGVRCSGVTYGEGDRNLTFECTIDPDGRGRVVIDDRNFDLAAGRLFLVKTRSDRFESRQIDRDLKSMSFGAVVPKELAEKDEEIRTFFEAD
ncbi:MAG TPA: hypothetical protein VK116_15875 [Planctomycetota bacterium]|nr:hypothetical protein [Planctomycetota bacterium]